MSIHSGHRKRKKDAFLERGFKGCSPHEILEFLLFYSIPRSDTNPIAHNLIKEFGTLSAVFDAEIEDLERIPGISNHSAILIKLMPELFRLYRKDLANIGVLSSIDDIGKYFVAEFTGLKTEVVMLLCLDSKNRVLCCREIDVGDVTSSRINIRKITDTAAKYNAASVVLAHNHPGGSPLPSREDFQATSLIEDALSKINLRFIDHLIICDDDYVSIRDSRMIKMRQ